MKSHGDSEYKKGSSHAGQRTREAACPWHHSRKLYPRGLVSIAEKRGWGKELHKHLLLLECARASTPPPIRRAVLKDEECCLGFWKEDPRTCVNERRGSHSWQKNKALSRSPAPRARPELVDWAARPLPLGSPNSVAVSCCILEDRSLPLWLALYGTINEECSDSRHLSILFRAWACDQTIRHCPPGSTEKCLLSSL